MMKSTAPHLTWTVVIAAAGVMMGACRPGDILNSVTPTGVIPSSTLQSQSGAEQAYAGAAFTFASDIEGANELTQASGLFSDEFNNTWACCGNAYVDARYGADNVTYSTPQIYVVGSLLSARIQLLTIQSALQQYEPSGGRSIIGDAYALVGYTELLIAEDYCAGVPLDQVLFGGGTAYGQPLTNDSLLAVAETHFDSALAYANGNDTVQSLASVGMGRALLDRGRYDSAALAVQNVPTGFVYNLVLAANHGSTYAPVNLYEDGLLAGNHTTAACATFSVSDREGGNGLNFVSAQDPRLVLDPTIAETCDGAGLYAGPLPDSVFYYPVKFGNPSTAVPLATGVEARLIEAEAALQANQVATWATDLNNLRNAAPSTYLQLANAVSALTSDSTITAPANEQVDVMFRERAFWLFGLGNRLGDLRRLVRQYNRPAESVYPTGVYDPALQSVPGWVSSIYPSAPQNYRSDVTFGLPTPGLRTTPVSSNPAYKGCTTSTATA